MKRRVSARVWGGVLAALVAAPLWAAEAEDPFYKGLQERGLKSLMKAYVEQGGVRPTAGVGETGMAGSKVGQAVLRIQQAALAKTVADRDASFEKAKELYEQAIAEAQEALAGSPATDWKARADARLPILTWRAELAGMIFQNWLKNDLDLLEVTDCRGGDREKVARLLQTAEHQYRAAFQGSIEWQSEIDRDPDRNQYVNAGYTRRLRDIQRDAQYYAAWTTYYRAWMLPKDYRPPQGGRSREELLNDAITAFQPYRDLPDTVPAKWYAYLVAGLAQRELGKYEDALTSLANADNAEAPAEAPEELKIRVEALKIRVAFEIALTRVRQGKFKEARKVIENAREFFGKQKISGNLYGLAMPIVEAESYLAEAKAANDTTLKDKGVELLKTLNQRDPPWPYIVLVLTPSLVGEQGNIEQMEPFGLWILATDTFAKAREAQDSKQLEYALRLFKIYVQKAGEKDANYAAARYNQAACLLQLGRKEEAADAFKGVAESAPDYQYAAESAKYYVGVRGQLYEAAKTPENRDAYEKALAWFVSSDWLKTDPDQQYFYALVLYRGEKHEDAAAQFAKVPRDSEFYPDARYWVALCRFEGFREKILPTGDKAIILSRARVVAQELTDFANYARQAQGLPDEKRQQVLGWAQAACLNAAAVYMYPEVGLYDDGLQVLKDMEKTFQLDKEIEGRVLKYKIEALQKLRLLDEGMAVLDTFLAQARPEEVGPVLGGFFQAVIEDVERLIRGGDKDAVRAKVKDAEQLGDLLRKWFETSNVENKQQQAENIQYEMAEVYLAVGDYERALATYTEIGGPKPEQEEEGRPIKVDCVYGMVRCYEALAETAPDATQARPHFERALELWRVLLEIEEQARASNPARLWDFRYHNYYCRYRLGDKEEVRKALESLAIIVQPQALGGADPILQKKFRDLLGAVSPAP
ncbi:MAG: tetratricopeptide repeat protein [Phycisphaerae bacterium]